MSMNLRRRIGLCLLGMAAAAGLAFCASRSQGTIVLCAGDSITEKTYPRLLQKIFKQEGLRARILDYGKSGHTSGEYLRFLRGRLKKIDAERPDFVLLQLGTNDVRVDGDRTSRREFTRNLREIIGVFQGLKTRAGKTTKVFVATIPPVPSDEPHPFGPESSRRVTEEINPAVRDIAGEMKIVLVDNHALFAAEPGLLSGVHPSPQGYERLALSWFQALRPFLD